MIKSKNIGIQRAKQLLHEMSLTDTIRETIEEYRKIKLDRKAEDAYVYDQGLEAGEQIGRQMGEQIGKQAGELNMLFKLVSDHTIDLNTAAEKSGLTPQEFEEKLAEAGYHFQKDSLSE